MRLAPITLALVLLAPAIAAAQTSTPTFPAPTPGTGSPWDGLNLLLTRQRLQEIQGAVTRQDPVAVQACADAIAAADAALAQTPDPIQGVLRVPAYYGSQKAVQQQITARLRGDGRAALALAWGHALTGRQDYATASKRFIFAWVNALTKPVDGPGAGGLTGIIDWIIGDTGGDTALVVHYSFPLFLYAYDILNGFGQLSGPERDQFKRWLAPFVAYRQKEERFVNNHQNWQVLFLGVAAHVTEDQNLLDLAVGYYRHGMRHQQIAADGAMWRELARGEKAATYTLMALEAMVQFVVIAERHGVPGLRDVVADPRPSSGTDALELKWVTSFHHSGVASGGGTLHQGLDQLRDFVNDPRAWSPRFQNVTHAAALNGPAQAGDWGWLFEVGYAWWGDASYLPLLQKAPYGLQPERAYTLGYATLLFRPF